MKKKTNLKKATLIEKMVNTDCGVFFRQVKIPKEAKQNATALIEGIFPPRLNL